MRQVTLSFLTCLLASGCGSTPASPTPAAAPAPRVVALGIQVSPDAEAGKGWGAPTAVALWVTSGPPAAVIEKAVLKMIDENDETLSEASITLDETFPPEGQRATTNLVQTMTWPVERGYAKRLDITLTMRSASGELSTVTTSVKAK